MCICSLFRRKDDVNVRINCWSKYFSTNDGQELVNVDWKEKTIEWMKRTVPQELTSAKKNAKWSIVYAWCSGHIHDHASYRHTCQMWIQASLKKEVKTHSKSLLLRASIHVLCFISNLKCRPFFLSLSRQVKKYAKSMCLKILVLQSLSFMSPCVVSWTKWNVFLYLIGLAC